jgi:hypothetical protein
MVLGFEISPQPDKDRDDEPAKQEAEDETPEVFQL